ncbi:dehydrogenase [Alphaproteobacteria bacterium]|nr:dehydrogenase [Alphaproteobacteria bacterium]
MSFHPSVCAHDCPSVCPLSVELTDAGEVGLFRGVRGHPYSQGVICAKVGRYRERVHHPDRLTRPLIASGPKGSGQFRPIGWDEAEDRIAERFMSDSEKWGPEAIWPYHYAGTMGLAQRGAIERLRRLSGWSEQHETFCVSIANPGWLAGTGARIGVDTREMVDSDLIVIWGGNPVHTQIHVMNWIEKARRARGTKLAVIDPYRTATAERADLHLALRPGSDGALAVAVLHVLFAEGYADRAYLARATDYSDRLDAHLESRTPQWAAAITGLSAEAIRDFAILYGTTKRSFIRIGHGFTRQRNGAAAMHAVSCLPAATGAWTQPGGGALFGHGDIYRLETNLIDARDFSDPATRKIDMSRIGAALTGDQVALSGGPPVASMFIQNVNPAITAPNSSLVAKGLAREDLFLVVHEQFMTDTARFADIVLPATTFVEHDDLYRASGHTFLQVSRAVIPPVGEARSNHRVVSELARRLGVDHPAFAMTEWALIDAVLKASGKPSADEIWRMGGVDCALSFEESHFLNGFGHPDRRFHFAPDWGGLGPWHDKMPPLPDHLDIIDRACDEKPFRLVAAPSRNYLNSSFTETPTGSRLEGRPTLKVHPAICERLGLAEGDIAVIGNEQGEIPLHVAATDGMDEATLVVESIWPARAFLEGSPLNTLIADDPAPPAGGGAFHDTAVWLRGARVL